MLNIRPSIELCCLVVFDLSCNDLFRFFFFVLFVFLLLLPFMANKVVCVVISLCYISREQFSFQLPSVVLLRRKEKLESNVLTVFPCGIF